MDANEAAAAQVARVEARDVVELIDKAPGGRGWLHSRVIAWEGLPPEQRRIRKRHVGWPAMPQVAQELTATVYVLALAHCEQEGQETLRAVASMATRVLTGERARKMGAEEARAYVRLVAENWGERLASLTSVDERTHPAPIGKDGFVAAQRLCGALFGMHRGLKKWKCAGGEGCPRAEARALALNIVFSMRDLLVILDRQADSIETAAKLADTLAGGPYGGNGWSAASWTRLATRLAERWAVFLWPWLTPDATVRHFSVIRSARVLPEYASEDTIWRSVDALTARPGRMFDALERQERMLDLDAEHIRAGIESEQARAGAQDARRTAEPVVPHMSGTPKNTSVGPKISANARLIDLYTRDRKYALLKSDEVGSLIGVSGKRVRNLPAWKARTSSKRPNRYSSVGVENLEAKGDSALDALIKEGEADARAERRGKVYRQRL